MNLAQAFVASADELSLTADRLSKIATELNGVANDMQTDPTWLRDRAQALKAEAMRCAVAALDARGVAERLATVAEIAQVDRG